MLKKSLDRLTFQTGFKTSTSITDKSDRKNIIKTDDNIHVIMFNIK